MDFALLTSLETQTWCRLDLPSCLPEGLQHLALPPLFLPDETVEEISNLTELTRLECMGWNGYWPSQDLIGLKVRSRSRSMLQGCHTAVMKMHHARHIQIHTLWSKKFRA